ncbi:CsiV family protein [Motilimonas eburnea]|uniref:CsiV family protein n=1 Tax=Motilimonas eburnea TaxID=1737488 RepID=UPI001E6027C6|nr:CsiV family protein [Motilimonas eburnea]MCE2572496.1 peptidoglycan binding protein CsiV [Motilimonas eburnea]
MLSRLILALCVMLATFSVVASERYKVELIAFKNYESEQSIPEHFDYRLPLAKSNQGLNLLGSLLPTDKLPITIDSTKVSASFQQVSLLPASSLQLKTEMKRLTRHLAFSPLIHLAWSVEVSPQGAPSVRLLAGQNFQKQYQVSSSMVGLDALGSLFELDGLITLYQDQQLILETELVLRDAPAYDGTATLATKQGPLKEYPIKHRRAVSLGKIYYLDHPLMGLLVRIDKA